MRVSVTRVDRTAHVRTMEMTSCAHVIRIIMVSRAGTVSEYNTGLIIGLRPGNEGRRYFVTTSFIGWAQA